MEQFKYDDISIKRKELRKKAFNRQSTKDYKIYENINKLDKQLQNDDKILIKKVLQQNGIFYSLNEQDIEELIQKFFYCQVKEGEEVFKQGSEASCFFIIERGSVKVIINDVQKKKLERGECFGELALLYNAPRSATIKTEQTSNFWALDRMTFKTTVEEIIERDFTENRKFINNVKITENFTEEQKNCIAKSLITQQFKKGENIINEGEKGSSFYLIKSGQVLILKANKEIRKLKANDSFGEGVLLNDDQIRACTCQAVDQVICLSLGKENLIEILGDQLENIISRNILKWGIDKSKHLSKLTPMQREMLYNAFKAKSYKAGDVVFSQGTAVCKKIVISQTSNLIRSDDKVMIAHKNQCFHDSFFTKPYRDKAFDENVVIENDGVVFELTLEDLINNIGGEISEVLKRNEKQSHEIKMENMKKQQKINYDHIQIDQLVYIKKLGQGQFGNVYLVQNNQTLELFALKCVKKSQIISQNLEVYLSQEKQVCQLINFPFCMKFIKTFKDDYHIFFLLEFIQGMELFDGIREIGLLSTYKSQFYISQILLSIEYLHNLKILYRDIKPENIMIDNNGYLKLIDMGTAKIMNMNQQLCRTFTIIGTPHYMAPEIMTGKGYSFYIDLWSIGVCLYEFMCGYVPFGEDAEDPYQIYQQIMFNKLSYPEYMTDKKAIKLIEQLLNKIPEIRLGQSFASLKKHVWFQDFDWDQLLEQKLQPPFIPNQDKQIQKNEIEKQFQKKKLITQELYKGEKLEKFVSQVVDWDKEF